MKKNNIKYIIKYFLLVSIILIGLSCDDANLLSPNSSPEYALSMNVIGSTGSYYADSCDGCEDPNPIEVQVTLKNNNVPVSDADIIFTYESNDISISDPFDNSTAKTSTSGIAIANYNDNGKTGTMQVTATYLNPSYPDTIWSQTSDYISCLLYTSDAADE